MNIIGLTGNKRCGKDTAGEYLASKHGYIKLSFAALLKEVTQKYLGAKSVTEDDRENIQEFNMRDSSLRECANVLGLNPQELVVKTKEAFNRFAIAYNDDYTTYRMTYRQVLQIFGTEACRALYDDIWINSVIDVIRNNPNGDYVITDVRFDNEAAILEHIGSTIVRINRVGAEGDGHASEVGVSSAYIHYDVENTTLESLYSQLEDIHVENYSEPVCGNGEGAQESLC